MSENKFVLLLISLLIILKILLSNRIYIIDFQERYIKAITLLTITNIFVYRYIIKILLLKMLYQESIIKIEKHIASLYYILLVGAIGSRKTANLTAFAQMCEMAKIKKMHEFQYKTRALLTKTINFEALDEAILKNFNPHKVHDDKAYKYFIYKNLKKNQDFTVLSKRVNFESFRTPKILDLLAEYLEVYYYINFRKINILSNTTIQSVNTGLNSIPVKESFFQLYRKNPIAHEKYLVIVEDEKGVVDNARVYARMDKDSVKNNDDGKDIHAMLQRHGSKGTNTTLVVSQSEKDVTANRRRLPNRFVEFLKPSDAYIFNIERHLISYLIKKTRHKELKVYNKTMRKVRLYANLFERTNRTFFIDKAEKLYQKYHNFLDKDNKFKRRIKHLETLNIYLGKYLYLVQPCYLHESEERIGQRGESETIVTNSFPMTLIYPANITFDRYDQFAFYDVYNERNKKATTPLAKVPPFKNKIMSRKEHESMEYRAINRIFEEIDEQDKPVQNPTSLKSKALKSTPKPKQNIKENYDVF